MAPLTKMRLTGFSSASAWAFAVFMAILLNIAFFGLMPGLMSRPPEKPDIPLISDPTPVYKVVPPKKYAEIKPKKKLQQKLTSRSKESPKKVFQRTPDIKISPLPLELNPELPPGEVVLPPPLLDSVDLPEVEFSGVFDEIHVDVKPAPIATVKPIYPLRAERLGIQGYVVVELTVTKEGLAKDIAIVEAKPENVFEQSVINCVSSWRFSPGKKGGQPVETRKVRQLIKFQLEN